MPRSRSHDRPRHDTVGEVFASLADDPRRWLREWNWKAAITSSMARSGLCLVVNLSAGVDAAQTALVTEALRRVTTSGFYGSPTASTIG